MKTCWPKFMLPTSRLQISGRSLSTCSTTLRPRRERRCRIADTRIVAARNKASPGTGRQIDQDVAIPIDGCGRPLPRTDRGACSALRCPGHERECEQSSRPLRRIDGLPGNLRRRHRHRRVLAGERGAPGQRACEDDRLRHGPRRSSGLTSLVAQAPRADRSEPWRQCSASIGLLKVPMVEISTSTVSPAFISSGGFRLKPTPPGVPVAMTSPGGVRSRRNIFDDLRDRENQQVDGSALHRLAVQPRCERQPGRIWILSAVTSQGPNAPVAAKVLARGPLRRMPLPIAQRTVVVAGVPGDIVEGLVTRNMTAAFADDDGKFAFIVELRRHLRANHRLSVPDLAGR